jgi:hypothetical protein
MKVTAGKLYAVITGDIVGSSALKSDLRQRLLQAMREGSQEVQRAFPRAVPLPVEIFRGDGWQMLLTDPLMGLRVALFYRAFLLANSPETVRFDTRLAIAVGAVDFVPAKRVSQGDGGAYRASGQALENLGKKEWMALVFPNGATPPMAAAIVGLIDSHVQSWTSRQARAVMGALLDRSQEEIADLWPKAIAQPTVGAHLDKAGWPAVARGLRCVEHSLAEIPGIAPKGYKVGK